MNDDQLKDVCRMALEIADDGGELTELLNRAAVHGVLTLRQQIAFIALLSHIVVAKPVKAE